MKLLVLTNLYPPHYLGGYELICSMVTNELRARGHQVDVLTSDHTVAGAGRPIKESGVERSLRIHGFYGHPWLNIVNLRYLEQHNNDVLRKAIAERRPDLVYVWNMGGLSKSMVLTLQRMGIPTVFYLSDHWIARGFTSDVWLQWWNRRGFPQMALRWLGVRNIWDRRAPTNPLRHLRFQRLYFCSKALRKLTASAGFEVMHGAVIYAPVDTRRFDGTPKAAAQPLRKLLWVGRLAPDKGIKTALQAMRLLKDRFEGSLSIYGQGEPEYTRGLREFAGEQGISASFSAADAEAMPKIYREHDALLFTSEWAEPFALTPLEAMASGLPVIGTMTGGSREIFRCGDNALTYSAGNAEELAQRVLELDRDPGGRARIASTGRAEVRSQYSLPVIVNRIERYLKESIETWTPPGLPHYAD